MKPRQPAIRRKPDARCQVQQGGCPGRCGEPDLDSGPQPVSQVKGPELRPLPERVARKAANLASEGGYITTEYDTEPGVWS